MENIPHPTASPTDESLAQLAARGDSDPFASLVERYAAKVVSVVEQAIGDHHLARDLAQEVWMKVHRGLGVCVTGGSRAMFYRFAQHDRGPGYVRTA